MKFLSIEDYLTKSDKPDDNHFEFDSKTINFYSETMLYANNQLINDHFNRLEKIFIDYNNSQEFLIYDKLNKYYDNLVHQVHIEKKSVFSQISNSISEIIELIFTSMIKDKIKYKIENILNESEIKFNIYVNNQRFQIEQLYEMINDNDFEMNSIILFTNSIEQIQLNLAKAIFYHE